MRGLDKFIHICYNSRKSVSPAGRVDLSTYNMSRTIKGNTVPKGTPIVIPGAEFMTKEELAKAKKNESQRRLMARRRGGEPVEKLTKQEIRKLETAEMVELAKDTRNLAVQALNKMLLLLNTDDEMLKKMNPTQIATVFGIMFDKARLAEGMSTENIAIQAKIDINMSSDKALEELNKMREKFSEMNTK